MHDSYYCYWCLLDLFARCYFLHNTGNNRYLQNKMAIERLLFIIKRTR